MAHPRTPPLPPPRTPIFADPIFSTLFFFFFCLTPFFFTLSFRLVFVVVIIFAPGIVVFIRKTEKRTT